MCDYQGWEPLIMTDNLCFWVRCLCKVLCVIPRNSPCHLYLKVAWSGEGKHMCIPQVSSQWVPSSIWVSRYSKDNSQLGDWGNSSWRKCLNKAVWWKDLKVCGGELKLRRGVVSKGYLYRTLQPPWRLGIVSFVALYLMCTARHREYWVIFIVQINNKSKLETAI